MAPRTGLAAVAAARNDSASGRYIRPGLCLKTVRGWFNVAAQYPDAKSAWYGCPTKHTSRANIPVGAPVWFFGLGRYEHIALYLGKGKIATTDYPRRGYVGIVDMGLLERDWNCYFKGWGEHVNGVRVVSEPKPRINITKAERARTSKTHLQAPTATLRIQQALARRGYLPRYVPGRYGKATNLAYKRWQRANGWQATGELLVNQVQALVGSSFYVHR